MHIIYYTSYCINVLEQANRLIATLHKPISYDAGTANPGGTRKPDNPLKGTQNPIPRNLDNPLRGIRDLVQNGTWSQKPRGLIVPT